LVARRLAFCDQPMISPRAVIPVASQMGFGTRKKLPQGPPYPRGVSSSISDDQGAECRRHISQVRETSDRAKASFLTFLRDGTWSGRWRGFFVFVIVHADGLHCPSGHDLGACLPKLTGHRCDEFIPALAERRESLFFQALNHIREIDADPFQIAKHLARRLASARDRIATPDVHGLRRQRASQRASAVVAT
jgi:hypothetical protein